jgi:HEAT repeats
MALITTWIAAGSLAALYVAVGIAETVLVDRRQHRLKELRTALAVEVVDRISGVGTNHPPSRTLARLRRDPGPLNALATSLAERGGAGPLCQLAEETGVARRVRRLGRRRSWQARSRAAQLLRLIPPEDPMVPHLLGDVRPEVRARALDSIGPDALVLHLELVIKACDSPDSGTRFAAEQALQRGDGRPVERLAAVVIEADRGGWSPLGVSSLLRAVAGIPDHRIVAAVAASAWDGDPEHRRLAAEVLASGLATEVQSRLRSMLGDSHPGVRASAADALGRLGDPTAVAMLGRRLDDTDWYVRRAAGYALLVLGPAGLLVLRTTTRSPDRYARDMAGHMLAQHELSTAHHRPSSTMSTGSASSEPTSTAA